MPEYYGYVAPDQVNLGKSIANVAEMFIAAEDKRKAKREGEQKSLDESRKKISELEQNSNQSQAELVGKGADKARSFILELERMRKSGQISGAEFNRQMTNLNDSWDSYAFTTKNMGEKLAEIGVRQQSGEDGTPPAGSYNEPFLAQIQTELLNTENKDWAFNEGNMYMVDKNSPSTPINLKSLANLDNIIDNRVDVPSLIQANVSKFGVFQNEDGTTTIGGPTADPELYKEVKYDIVHSIVNENNPRAIVSILADNAGIHLDQYWNEAGKQEKLNEAVAREEALNGAMTPDQKSAFMSEYEKNNMVKYAPDKNGVYQPVLSKEMIDKAFSYVERNVDIQAGRTVAQDEPFKPSNPSGPSGPSGESKNTPSTYEVNLASKIIDAWPKDVSAMRKATNNKYYFRWEDDGLAVYKEDPYEYDKEKRKYDKLSAAEKLYSTEPEKPKSVRRGLGSVDQLGD